MVKLSKELKKELNEFLAENLFGKDMDYCETPPNYIEDYRPVLEWLNAEDDVCSVELIKDEKGKPACRLTCLVNGNDFEICREMFSAFLDTPFEAQSIFSGSTIGEAICLTALKYLIEIKCEDTCYLSSSTLN